MKINFEATFNTASGYGNASVHMAKWLASLGNDVSCIHDGGFSNLRADDIMKLLKTPRMEGARNLNHCIPANRKYDALWTIAEFKPISFNWKFALDNAKTVCTQSKFSKECLESVTSRPIEVVPNGIEMSFGLRKPSITLPSKDPKNPTFRFFSLFEWVPRKEPELLIRSFCEEFKPEDNVELWIRSWNAWKNPLKEIPMIAREYPKMRNKIYYLKNYINDMQLIYQLFDGYVLPCAGEGFGITFLEAMACGLKPIGPNHGGSLEFMNDKNSYLVDCGDWEPLIPFGTGELFSPDSKWKVPLKDSLKAKMREAFEKKERLSKFEVNTLKRTWSWESAAKKMQKALEK